MTKKERTPEGRLSKNPSKLFNFFNSRTDISGTFNAIIKGKEFSAPQVVTVSGLIDDANFPTFTKKLEKQWDKKNPLVGRSAAFAFVMNCLSSVGRETVKKNLKALNGNTVNNTVVTGIYACCLFLTKFSNK
jgi:hypothetical protein